MDSFLWNAILHINPFSTKDDIEKCEWVNEYDIFIQFKNGKKYIYDTFYNSSRLYNYTSETITEEEWRREFKIRLNNILVRSNTSQEELAKYLGTNQQTVSRYCTGKMMPNIYTINKIAMFFGIDYKELLFIDYSKY